MAGNIFSDSWYKVAKLQVSLIFNIHVKKQNYRGQNWYILEDNYNNQFYKVTPEAYAFIMRLKPSKSVEEVWESCLLICPESAPTQDEVIHILMSLHHKNLLYFKNKADNLQLHERFLKRKTNELKGQLFSFMYLKIPLWNPDYWLDSVKPLINSIFSTKFIVVWFITLFFGIKAILENYTELYSQSQGMLSPNNLILLTLSILFLKILHEFGHAMMVKFFGGKVTSMGLMLLVFTPIPFMDATQSWLFRSKYKRALVGAAGMMVELFFAALAAIVWANSGDGLLHSVSFNLMVVGSVSSVMFNGNPLLRFDSYFILSDLIEIPNLYERSKKQWYYLVERYIFRIENIAPISDNLRESTWLFLYGISSFFYRLLVAFIIAIFISDQWFFLGVLVVLISLYLWVVKPFTTFLYYLISSNKLYKTRARVVAITLFFMTLFIVLIGVIPFVFSIEAKGVLLANDSKTLYVPTAGYLSEVLVKNGETVDANQTVAILKNEELEFDLQSVEASINESNAYMLNAREKEIADILPIKKHIALLENKLKILQKQKSELIIKSPIAGTLIIENLQPYVNTWFSRARKIATILPNKDFHFQAVVLQEEAYNLFQTETLRASVKLYGMAEETLQVSSVQVIPYQKNELPSAALGWLGGGDIAVSQSDRYGTKTIESFFEVRADLGKNDALNHYNGRSGILKINLAELTIAQRVILSVKQTMQKRYKL